MRIMDYCCNLSLVEFRAEAEAERINFSLMERRRESFFSLMERRRQSFGSLMERLRESFRAEAEAERINGSLMERLREPFRAEAEAERIKAFLYSFPNQQPGKFPVNKGGKDHLGELAEEPFYKGAKDPGHDGQGYLDFTQRKVLDAEAHVIYMSALAA